ncbi:protein kinase [Scytonema sp. UIC 10036]|uniref:serine/threonine-protein kinase n=1 Tax=Scytonema sp. UIC 10036 TaxID=2304196 RepID=UPI0012DA9C82|nr:serine/threonine-protein kinase [Scytonema sp. UIC 10036]MUG99317.1 protein kinase [Scytonema sp. UIC 10036]
MNGQLLGGRYQIIQVLAQGGFGQTYLAHDAHRPGHPVCVVKQLRPTKQNPELMPKIQLWFKNEAEILERLGLHDQIPQLLAYFEENKEFYLVQEYIAGHTLSQELILGQPWDSKRVTNLLTGILEILQFVHSYGVIHRDVKPSNLIRRQTDDKLVLIDFGTVKQIPPLDEQGVPNLTMAVGTPAYMPPEQVYGYPQLNSDIYAVGVIGIQAASGLSAQEVKTLIDPNSPYASIKDWRDSTSISQELTDILEKMVESDRRQRYQTVDDVLQELQKIDQPSRTFAIESRSPIFSNSTDLTVTVSNSPPQQQFLTKWLPIGLGVMTLAIATAGGLYFFLVPNSPVPKEGNTTVSQQPKPSSKEEGYTLARVVAAHESFVWSVALSADGQTLASGSEDKTIKIWQVNTGTLLHTLKSHSENVRAVSLSADGQTLASGSGDNTIKIWQTRTGQLLNTLRGHSQPVWSVTLSRDGQTLVSGSEDNTIKIWNVRTGELLRTLNGHTSAVFSLALTPDGLTLVSGSQDKTIKIWNLQTGKLIRTLEDHTDAVRSVTISPDGQKFASGSWDNTIKVWNITTGKLLRSISGHSDRVVAVAFGFDGETLASASVDKTVKIWDLQTGNLYQTLSGHSDWVLSMTMSSWGHILVSGSRDRTMRIWK